MKKLSKILAVVLCLVMAVSLLTFGVSAAEEKCVELTVDSLGLKSQKYNSTSPTSEDASDHEFTEPATVDGIKIDFIQLGNYGDGLQIRDKSGKTSKFWNVDALGAGITRIEFVYSDTKSTYDNNNMIVNFGKELKGADDAQVLVTSKSTKTYTITPNADDYTYFYMEWDTGYTAYWKSIKVYYTEAEEVVPPAEVEMINVYVSIDSETAPMAWAWGEYGNAFEAWPGVAMTAEGDLWKIEVPKGTTGFIANNGNGTQTSDIAIDGTKDCWITVSADYKTVEVSYEAPSVEEEIKPPAQTGDMSIAGLALVALAATAGLVVMKKKEN
jgi:hypothetical protein